MFFRLCIIYLIRHGNSPIESLFDFVCCLKS
nr:MAG TPA: ubiquitin-associated and SH3 domain-containing protein [Caudoviricetes sp.]